MKNKFKLGKISVLVASLAGCTALTSCNASKGMDYMYKVDLGDNNALLSNPGMGWDFCYYSNRVEAFGTSLKENDCLDFFPCDIVYFRLGWKYFQPEKDRFDWSYVDSVVDQWVAAGKRVAFCWEVCSPNTMDGQSCPLWLRDECGCSGVEYELYEECKKYGIEGGTPGVKTWVPDYGDPIFLQYFRAFLDEAAKKYDGKPWLEFIEIGSMGTWGEGHQHMSWPCDIRPEDISKHLRMWREAFPNSTVLVNDDLITNRDSSIELSKELGLGCVDDGVQVPDGNPNEPYGRYANEDVLDCFWRDTPTGIEHHPNTVATEVYYDSLWLSHASWCRLHMNPYHMKNGSGDWVDKMTRRMGYRLRVNNVEFTNFVPGQTAKVKIAVMNTGVAPCYKGGFFKITVKSPKNVVLGEAISDFNVRNLKVYSNPNKHDDDIIEFEIPVPSDAHGKYSIYLSCGDAEGNPVYNLPLDHESRKSYKIATFNLNVD